MYQSMLDLDVTQITKTELHAKSLQVFMAYYKYIHSYAYV